MFIKNILTLTTAVSILFLLSCQFSTNSSSELVDIRLNIDKVTYNPVLEKNAKGTISVDGIYADGTNKALKNDEIVLSANTKFASGNVQVISLDGNKIIPKEGGVASIDAVLIKDGKTFHTSKNVTVRPFYREYHKTLVMKLFMGMHIKNTSDNNEVNSNEDNSSGINCNFGQALEVIKKTDNLTRGIPKIIYLVGWQKGGHDYIYPAWSEVDENLKRPEDPSALESLRWLIREGKKYNTTVSLHINMVDAYEHSPLWSEYVEKDIIAKDTNGILTPKQENPNDGRKCYHISYAREWEEGLATRRIDKLIKMIPELKDGHTIHIDVFVSQWNANKAKWNSVALSPWHERKENGGYTVQKDLEAQRKIFKYWREKGFDVTGEGILWAHPPGEGFYGLQAMSWWYPNLKKSNSVEHQLNIPEKLMARGKITDEGGDYRFGASMQGEPIYKKDRENLTGFLDMFCKNTLPWYYLSENERIAFNNEILYYSNGIVAGNINGDTIITKGDYILRDRNDLFVEAKWKEQEIIAYSENGYRNREWQLPESWKNVSQVNISNITISGLEVIAENEPINSNKVTLSLEKGQAFSITPNNQNDQQ